VPIYFPAQDIIVIILPLCYNCSVVLTVEASYQGLIGSQKAFVRVHGELGKEMIQLYDKLKA